MPARPRPAALAEPDRRESFRPDVEGLRAVAVLLVIAGHVLGVPDGGYIGVDVFFVISGFLITGLLLREHERSGRISLRDFYARRVRRLLPAAVLVLAVTNVAAWLLLNGERAGQALRDAVWALLLAANVRFADVGTDYFDQTRPASPVQHYWSLAVEEQFYLVWPCLLLLALLRGRRGVVAALVLLTSASLAWSVWATAADSTSAYFSSLTRAWELGAGALVAVAAGSGLLRLLSRRLAVGLSLAGLAGVLASAFVLSSSTPFPGAAALLPVLATVLVLVGGEAGAADRNPLLVNPVARYLGRISYSLYLWHWPVLVLAAAVLPEPARVPVVLGSTLVLAALSSALVEEPVRRSAWLSRRPAPLARRQGAVRRGAIALGATAGLLGAGFAAPALGLWASAERPAGPPAVAAPSPEDIRASLAPAAWPALTPPLAGIREAGSPEWIVDRCDNVNAGNVERCRYGRDGANRTAALVGDSMAISWLPALRAVLEPRGFTIHVLTRNQCPAAELDIYRERPEEPYVECDDHKDWVLEQVRALRPELVVVSSAVTMVDKQVAQPAGADRYARWADGTARTLVALAEVAPDVVVLGAPPRAGNVQECVTRLSEPGDCTEQVPAQWEAVRAAERQAAERTGASYVDPEPWFCVDGRCPAVVGSTPVYTDGRHLTEAYALRLVPHLSRALRGSVPV